MRVISGNVTTYCYFVAVDATDLKTRETGLSTWTVYRSRNGGVAAAFTTPTINETDSTNMPGVYELLLDEDTTIDAGDDSQEMVLHITHAGMAPVTRTIELYRAKITAGETLTVGSGLVTLPTIPTDWITADGIAADAIGSSELAASAITEIQSGLSTLTAAAAADAVWQEAIADHSGTLGSTAESLAAAGSAGDPWSTALPGAYGAGTAGKIVGDNINAPIGDVPTATENADALLNRDMAAVTDTNARSPLNAMRLLRNKWSVAGAVMTVTKEDDATSAWTAALSTDAAADPVTGSDPA